MKRARRRYVAFKLQLGKLRPDTLGDVTLRIAKHDLAALQTAWGYWLEQVSTADRPQSGRANEARAMSGTFYNLATSNQRGEFVDVRVNWEMARRLGTRSRGLLAEALLINDESVGAAAGRAIDALCTAGPSDLGRPGPSPEETQALATQRQRAGADSHNSRVRRAKARLRKNQNSAR